MNQDNYYPIEIKLCSKNGWHTPQEAQAYYGRYSREGITCHGWGDNSGADNHDNIVNYFLNQGNAGVKSTNYVLSDRKITLMVSPDNVAWCSQAGNPTTISIEHQPNLGAEGYKKSGWLVWQLEGRYGRRLSLYPHNKWAQTACPLNLDINRIRAEADKWATGGYLPEPPKLPPVVVPPTPPVTPKITVSYSKLPQTIDYVVNKDTNLWNFNSATWGGVKSIKTVAKGEKVTVFGIADNHILKAKYAMTQYSFGQADLNGSPKATNGFNMADLDLVPKQPIPTPPTPKPTKDEEQDQRLNALERAVKAIVDFLKGIFTNFKG